MWIVLKRLFGLKIGMIVARLAEIMAIGFEIGLAEGFAATAITDMLPTDVAMSVDIGHLIAGLLTAKDDAGHLWMMTCRVVVITAIFQITACLTAIPAFSL